MEEIIQYIIRFLTGSQLSDKELSMIGYTSDPEKYSSYKIVIKKSTFFNENVYGTMASLPVLPLKIWNEIPVLFGEGKTETIGKTIVIHADFIAGTFFLISRYEEMVRKNVRDEHGRFPGKESLPYRAGFIDRPVIEEWGVLLRSFMKEAGLKTEEPKKQISRIFLTHDVDQLAHFRNFRGMMGGFLRGIRRKKEGRMALKSYFGGLIFDPWYTFPFLYKVDTELRNTLGNDRCEIITFFRSGISKRKEDKPLVNLLDPDYRTLIRYTKRKKISFGLHASYEAGCNPVLIPAEKEKLETFTNRKITCNRNHFLNNREPGDFEMLIESGITDDFSMGYADMAGFRLGTCRPVKWINPEKKTLTSLTLHSLLIMDNSLSDKKYMYMNAHDAYEYCIRLFNNVESYNGELVFLWHNTMVENNPQLYHRKLYRDLLKYLEDK
jgi:hypothetical protein